MGKHAEGPGRRLDEADEARGAEMFAAGRNEREVADELGCSASTAHRLRERLQAAAELVDPAEGLVDRAAGGHLRLPGPVQLLACPRDHHCGRIP